MQLTLIFYLVSVPKILSSQKNLIINYFGFHINEKY